MSMSSPSTSLRASRAVSTSSSQFESYPASHAASALAGPSVYHGQSYPKTYASHGNQGTRSEEMDELELHDDMIEETIECEWADCGEAFWELEPFLDHLMSSKGRHSLVRLRSR